MILTDEEKIEIFTRRFYQALEGELDKVDLIRFRNDVNELIEKLIMEVE